MRSQYRERISALIETVSGLVWCMTPPNLREPNTLRVDKGSVMHLLATYEVQWGRATGIRSFAATFQLFVQISCARCSTQSWPRSTGVTARLLAESPLYEKLRTESFGCRLTVSSELTVAERNCS